MVGVPLSYVHRWGRHRVSGCLIEVAPEMIALDESIVRWVNDRQIINRVFISRHPVGPPRRRCRNGAFIYEISLVSFAKLLQSFLVSPDNLNTRLGWEGCLW